MSHDVHAISVHRQRARTRFTALFLALGTFAVLKLVALGALDVAAPTEGMSFFDVDCSVDTSQTAC